MNRLGIFAVMFFLLSCVTGCKHKVNQQVVESYADGRPKLMQEVVLSDGGDTILKREIFYFPGEKKYIEKQYNAKGEPEGVRRTSNCNPSDRHGASTAATRAPSPS